ncbi:MAG: hypothetical protein HZB17_10060 [Chloroflexi bacterium]|nr:hypothetical protein [Chloroflexota bacterium]
MNAQARKIFNRDVRRLCEHFDRYGVTADAGDLAEVMWKRYVIEKEEEVIDDE